MPRFLPILALLATVAAGPCPDHESRACLDYIRASIDSFEYARARDAAEEQCYGEPKADASGRVAVTALLSTTSGCHYLYAVERFFGNGMRAVEARDKARHLASWGCQAGYAELCEAQVALLEDAWIELLHEVEDEARRIANDERRPLLQSTALRRFSAGRTFPKSFEDRSAAGLLAALGRAAGKSIGARCDKDCQAREALDADLDIAGEALVLKLRLFDVRSRQLIWEKTFASRDVGERQRLAGFGTKIPDGPLTNRQIDAYEPAYKLLLGFGVARLPNVAGDSDDRDRFVAQVRSVERFHERRDEFGLMLSMHMTSRSFVRDDGGSSASSVPDATDGETADADGDGSAGSGTEAESTASAATGSTRQPKLVPYDRAYALYAIYNRMLFLGRESYDGLRPSLNLAVGGYVAGIVLAPTVRVGFDLYIARRSVISLGWLQVNSSRPIVDGEELTLPTVRGSELLMSFNF